MMFDEIFEEMIKELDQTEEIRELMVTQPVIWFVKYRTIRGIVQYLPCEGIESAREWAAKLAGQIMNVKI